MCIASPSSETAPISPLPPLVPKQIYTPEELRALPDDKLYELVNGQLLLL